VREQLRPGDRGLEGQLERLGARGGGKAGGQVQASVCGRKGGHI
jgi:hypothetical protein